MNEKNKQMDVTEKETSYKKKKFYKIDNSRLRDAGGFALVEAFNWSNVANQIYDNNNLKSQYCICSLLAIELFLKSILFNLGVNVTTEKNGHKIYEMYNNVCLTEDIRNELKKDVKIDKCVVKNFSSEYIQFNNFEEELNYISEDFCYLRYEYEKFLTGKQIIILKNFIKTLKDNAEKIAFRINGQK